MLFEDNRIECIIYYTKKEEFFDFNPISNSRYFTEKAKHMNEIFFNIDENTIIARFKDDYLINILEKIYNVIYIDEFYKYIPNIKINLCMVSIPKSSIPTNVDHYYKNKIDVKNDILKFKQKYDEISIKNYGVDSLYYILQSLDKLFMNVYLFNKKINYEDDLKYILCKNCKLKFLDLEGFYKNVPLLKNFLINNENLEYLHICIDNQNDINLLCEGLLQNNYLTSLNLSYSRYISYNDLIRIMNSSKSITNLNFSYINVKDDITLELFLKALENNTIITNFYMLNTYHGAACTNLAYSDKITIDLDNIIINLLKNNKTLTTLHIFDKKIIKYLNRNNMFKQIILKGLKNNNTLVDLGDIFDETLE